MLFCVKQQIINVCNNVYVYFPSSGIRLANKHTAWSYSWSHFLPYSAANTISNRLLPEWEFPYQ